MDEKAPKIDDKKFAAHMNKNKKPKTMTPGQKSFADIRKRADSMAQNPKIVRSRKSSPSLRRKLINATEQDMSGMCCKNCGDMYGKPTKENRSCMYNAYDPKGKNWINAEKYHEAMVNPQSNLTKKQRQALASPAAKAKPASQVSVKKAPFPIPDKKDVRREEVELDEAKLNIKKIHKAVDDGKSMDVIVGMFANRRTTNTDEIRKIVKDYKFKKRMRREAFDFKVNIDGFPEMFMSGNSPSEVKTHLRKLVKQPSMIQSVDRVTKADKKKHHRDKVNESLNEDAPCWDTHKQVGMKKKGNKMVPNCVPKNEDNEAVSPAQQAAIAMDMKARGKKPKDDDQVDELSLSTKDITKSGINPTVSKDKDKIKKDLEKLRKGLKDQLDKNSVKEKVEYVEYKFKNERDAKAAKKYFDGIQLMSFDVNDDNVRGGKLMVDAGKKDMTKYHKEVMKKFRPKVTTQEKKEPLKAGYYSRKDVQKQTGEKGTGTDTYKPKPKESYAPDEGTPEAKKKASKMTPGQTSKENFFKNLGNKIMGNKPTANQVRRSTGMSSRVNTNRNSTSGNQNSIGSRIGFPNMRKK